MSRQVNVYMNHRPIGSDDAARFLFPIERIINLNPIKRTCDIGRASKCVAKGISGAEDNAWFDSPVMSRTHAEFIYNPLDADNVVQIRDVGSLHGTFVNGEKLGDGARTLHNHDQIVFGIEVQRGSITFPACLFEITYETLLWKKPNRYTVPDSSDEEEAYNYNDEDMSEVDSQDHTSIEMIRSSPTAAPTPTASRSIGTIDLTLNDTPSPRLEPTLPLKKNGWAASLQQIAPKSPNPDWTFISTRPLQQTAPQSPIINSQENTMNDVISLNTNLISVEESARMVAETTYKSNFDDSSDDDQEDMISEPYDIDGSDLEDVSSNSENMSDLEDNDINSQVSEGVSSPNMSPASASRSSSPDVQSRIPMFQLDNADAPQSHLRTQLHTSEEAINLSRQGSNEEGSDEELSDYEEDDDDRSVGLSEAANEGIQTLVKDGLLENQPVYLPQLARPSLFELNRYASHNSAFMNSTAPQTTSAWSHDRDPSPSAVAMVKSPGTSNMAENSVDQTSEASFGFGSKGNTGAKELGNKTGKHAFFEARESNKMQFQARVEDENEETQSPSSVAAPVRAIKFAKPLVRVQSTGNGLTSKWERLECQGNNFDHSSMDIDQPSLEDATRVESDSKNFDPKSFWNEYTSRETLPKSNPIHPYYYSTDASSTAQESPVLEKFPTRSGLRIDDIIDGSSTGKKRKANEISDDAVLKNDVREWASSVVIPDNSTTQAVSEVAPKQSTPQPISSVLPTANIDLEHRPVKRLKMKKFAEAVGYFALGGAAVGAGLFSALVATAPDFL